MKIHGVKYICSRMAFIDWAKRHCPACNGTLKKVKASKIVNSRSEDAKNYDFSSGDGFLSGNVKFIWTEFYCSNCGKRHSFYNIYQEEKRRKGQKRDL